jgi:aminoglycoside phosphotransferase (APT) family kinase protein
VDERPLAGGGLTPTVRVGETVRRTSGPWTPAVHALLEHLEQVGFGGAPRARGIDAQGREVLSFVPGTADADPFDDTSLAAVARLVREYHDAATGFRPPPDATWHFMEGAPREGDIVCHNDLSPGNTIYVNGAPDAFVDWDLAAPGPRTWDVAHALWRFTPLYTDEDCRRLGIPVQPRGPRLRLFCDAYGLEDREGLVALIQRRQLTLYETARTWGEAGIPGWAEVWRDTRGEQWLRSMRYAERERDEWERHLLG